MAPRKRLSACRPTVEDANAAGDQGRCSMLGSSSLAGPLADEIGERSDTEGICARSSALRGDSIECREVILYAVFARLSRCAQPVDC
jgi:hypothetical protein